MKQSILILSLLFSVAASAQQQPQERVFTVHLSESQLNAVLGLINEAKLDGETRRQFDKLFRDQAIAQIQREQKQDSAKKQPPAKNEPGKKEGGKP